jgi:hypothetical protein
MKRPHSPQEWLIKNIHLLNLDDALLKKLIKSLSSNDIGELLEGHPREKEYLQECDYYLNYIKSIPSFVDACDYVIEWIVNNANEGEDVTKELSEHKKVKEYLLYNKVNFTRVEAMLKHIFFNSTLDAIDSFFEAMVNKSKETNCSWEQLNQFIKDYYFLID